MAPVTSCLPLPLPLPLPLLLPLLQRRLLEHDMGVGPAETETAEATHGSGRRRHGHERAQLVDDADAGLLEGHHGIRGRVVEAGGDLPVVQDQARL